MKTYIQIAMTTGHVYELPVAVVAADRAATMLKLHTDEFANIEEAMADTVELFKDDAGDTRDWALNQMNWTPDLEQHARLIRFTPPDTDLQYGEWTYHDHPAITGELDGNSIMKSPVEAVVTMMAEAQQLCNVTVMNGTNGEAFGAVVVIVGPPPVIGAYLSTLKYTGEQLSGEAAPAATH